MPELKPCPFCGREVQIFSIPRAKRPFDPKADKWYIQCKSCKCGMGRTRKHNLIKAWNRRPSPWIEADDPPKELNWEKYWLVMEESGTVPKIMRADEIWMDEGSEIEYYSPIPLLPDRKEQE